MAVKVRMQGGVTNNYKWFLAGNYVIFLVLGKTSYLRQIDSLPRLGVSACKHVCQGVCKHGSGLGSRIR